jgi:hypothetical protein
MTLQAAVSRLFDAIHLRRFPLRKEINHLYGTFSLTSVTLLDRESPRFRNPPNEKALRTPGAPLFLAPATEDAMQYSNRQWSVTDRNKFITVLTETGNPATAAAAIDKTLAAVYAMRDRSPLLADAWRRALGIAWEQVEMRMLSTLLDGDAGTIDPKVALEMLKRRPAAPARQLLTIDAARIAKVRSEIKALAVSTDG